MKQLQVVECKATLALGAATIFYHFYVFDRKNYGNKVVKRTMQICLRYL